MIQPGEVYMADFGPAGPHPVIVVSREELNRGRLRVGRCLHVGTLRCSQQAAELRSVSSRGFRVHRRLRGAMREHPLHRSSSARLGSGTDRDIGQGGSSEGRQINWLRHQVGLSTAVKSGLTSPLQMEFARVALWIKPLT